jgi:hypothetical protein
LQVKQLELDLWDVISSARQAPEAANLSRVFEMLDLTLVDLDMRSQLRVAGEAVCQIADLFCDRSSFLFEELQSRSTDDGPIMPEDAFDRYVRQSMVVDFEQFIQPMMSLPRKVPEPVKNGNSVVGVVDKEILIQALEQENLLSSEEEFEQAISVAHAENVSVWVEAIARCLDVSNRPMRLDDLQGALNLPIVEVWLGLLLGDFKLEQKGSFYNSNEIWIG